MMSANRAGIQLKEHSRHILQFKCFDALTSISTFELFNSNHFATDLSYDINYDTHSSQQGIGESVCLYSTLGHDDALSRTLLNIYAHMCIANTFPGAPEHTYT